MVSKFCSFMKQVLVFAAAILAGYAFFSFFMWAITALVLLVGLAGTAFGTVITVAAAIFLGVISFFVFATTLGIMTIFFLMDAKFREEFKKHYKAARDKVKGAKPDTASEDNTPVMDGAAPAAA